MTKKKTPTKKRTTSKSKVADLNAERKKRSRKKATTDDGGAGAKRSGEQGALPGMEQKRDPLIHRLGLELFDAEEGLKKAKAHRDERKATLQQKMHERGITIYKVAELRIELEESERVKVKVINPDENKVPI